MSYEVKQTDKEVDNIIDQCADSERDGVSKFPGMTYEQGVRAGIDWVTGNLEGSPLE